MNRCRICGQLYNGEFCSKCGAQFIADAVCPSCGSSCNPYLEFCPTCGAPLDSVLSDVTLSSYDDAEDDEHDARRDLWDAVHEADLDAEACLGCAKKLESFAPGDYFARFVETVFEGGDKALEKFLFSSTKRGMSVYADVVLDVVTKRMTPGLLYPVWNYIYRAFPEESYAFTKYMDLYEEAAERLDGKIFDAGEKRDVYISYSDEDTDGAVRLCEYLERKGFTCFTRQRNVRHGSWAPENPDKMIFSAIDACSVFLFISSKSSRNKNSVPFGKELPYLYLTDIRGVPASYRKMPYERLPAKYIKPRVEFVTDRYTYTKTDTAVRVVFYGFKRISQKDAVADRVRYLLGNRADDAGRQTTFVVPSHDELDGAIRKLSLYVDEREKNVLEAADGLLEKEDYSKAHESLKRLKSLETSCRGKCSGAVIYRMLLCDYAVRDLDSLEERLVENAWDIRQNENFNLLTHCRKCDEKTAVMELAGRIDGEIEAYARKRREDETARRREEREKKVEERRRNIDERIKSARPFWGIGVRKSETYVAVLIGVIGLIVFVSVAAATSGATRNWLFAAAILFSELLVSVTLKHCSYDVWDTYASVAQCVFLPLSFFLALFCDATASVYGVMLAVGTFANGTLYATGNNCYSDHALMVGHVGTSAVLIIVNALSCAGETVLYGGWASFLFILTYALLFASGCVSMRKGQHRSNVVCVLPEILMGAIVDVYALVFFFSEYGLGEGAVLFGDWYQKAWPGILVLSFLLVAGVLEFIRSRRRLHGRHVRFYYMPSLYYALFCYVAFFVTLIFVLS